MVFIIIFVIVVIGLVAYGLISNKKRRQAMAELAVKNSWTPLANDETTLNKYLPQYLQTLGQLGYGLGGSARTQSGFDMAYQTSTNGHSVVLFQYEYTEYSRGTDPSQPEQSTTRYFTVLSITMPVNEPTVLLMHHGFMSKLSNFNATTGLQQLTLEGSFNEYYDTYTTPDSQVAALSLLTPDVMELITALAGEKNHASIQISGQTIGLSFENQPLTPEFIEPLLGQLAPLLTKLDAKPQARL